MLNKTLNPKIFKKDIAQLPTRQGFGEGLVLAAEDDPNVVGLCADLTESTRMEPFAKKFPERFFEIGVAEQNLATIAAGLGVSGKIPFISSYAVFSPGRNWEQIRTTIAYNDSNVKIIGSHAGVSVGPDGATHQATEDIALMRVLPNMKVFVPCDAIEAKKATVDIAKIWGPCYLRLAREKSPVFTTEQTPFIPGKAQIFWEGEKPRVAIIACGPVVYNALLAARELAAGRLPRPAGARNDDDVVRHCEEPRGRRSNLCRNDRLLRPAGARNDDADGEAISVMVINCPTIKPLDERLILEAVEKCGAVVTVEEHQIAAGLGGAVAELLARERPTPMAFVGLNDTYGESGPPEELIRKYQMDAAAIKAAVKSVRKI